MNLNVINYIVCCRIECWMYCICYCFEVDIVISGSD